MSALPSSLRGRIFLACALVALVSLAVTLPFVTSRLSREAEADIRGGLERAARLVAEQHAARREALRVQAQLIADLPTLKAAVATGDAPTVEPVARELRQRAHASTLTVRDARGRALADLGAPAGRAVLQVATVPIVVGPDPPEVLGALSLGAALDDGLARQLQAVTDSEVAFASGGTVRASSLSPDADHALGALLAGDGVRRITLDGQEYSAVRRDLPPDGTVCALILRSRSPRLAGLRSFRLALLGSALLALGLALALSWAVARTVSQPLAALTGVMREMAATGDLTRRMERPAGWSDEEAAVVAAGFNALTEAIARFQREAALRERLSALGRMSTVLAHEVRNPLMIIKSSLATLRRGTGEPEAAAEAARDIEHEVQRLNRLVNDVLDFARPVRLEYGPVDLAALARGAAEAALAGEGAVSLALDVHTEPAVIESDGERLRTVLVNLLANAREAVLARRAAGGGAADGPDLRLRVEPAGAAMVRLVVEDRGPGIPPAQLATVFEPYFTTRRGGTGLGLPIARNIVESLGGSIVIESTAGTGTAVRVEIPRAPRERG